MLRKLNVRTTSKALNVAVVVACSICLAACASTANETPVRNINLPPAGSVIPAQSHVSAQKRPKELSYVEPNQVQESRPWGSLGNVSGPIGFGGW